jgi:DNA-binding NarL/FixJ family response regulator
MNLPDGVGTTVLARIRNEKRPIRVAVASGTSDQGLLAEAVRLDAEIILEMPIHLNKLMEWLDKPG